MRRPSPRCFASTATFVTFSGRPRAGSAGTALRCSVAPAAASRRARIGGLHPEATAVLGFPALPQDTSAGARAASASNAWGPEVQAQDTFTVAPAAGPAVVYQALGPALDQDGRGVLWEVDCKAIA